ncbi:unnamed protein product [Allacma fusca]|uniref:Uncharacterized protein n=1 Tax=Allacma fusca TaxID=39272 RepID=A0A8J2LSJ0_9HEXA|nr:unnamed protein product [Allacma fusca]
MKLCQSHGNNDYCNCPIPGSATISYNYYYDDVYYPSPSPPPPDTPEGICTSKNQRFANPCWLNVYNKIYGEDVTEEPESSCPSSICTCEICPVDEPYNPICYLNRTSGELTTISNSCERQCIECHREMQILHCGTCELGCPGTESTLNCLNPRPLCSNNNGAIKETCICFLLFKPVCAINPETKELVSFTNSCFYNCRLDQNLKLLYNVGSGSCPCAP